MGAVTTVKVIFTLSVFYTCMCVRKRQVEQILNLADHVLCHPHYEPVICFEFWDFYIFLLSVIGVWFEPVFPKGVL